MLGEERVRWLGENGSEGVNRNWSARIEIFRFEISGYRGTLNIGSELDVLTIFTFGVRVLQTLLAAI